MQLALATCAELPEWEKDDAPLHAVLRQLGHDVHLPVWDDPAVDWAAFDGVLIRTTWDYTDKHEDFVAWAQAVQGVTSLHNPADIVAWNTDKRYLKDLASQRVPTVPTVWTTPRTNLAEVLESQGWQRAFLKPTIGACGRNTLRFSKDDVRSARILTRSGTWLLQPYLSSVETEGEVSAIYIDGKLSHGVRKTPKPGDYRVQDDWGASDAPHTLRWEERAICERVLACFDEAPLYCRIDMLKDKGHFRVVELEAVEPSLFFRHAPHAARRLADAWISRLSSRPSGER